MSIKVRGGTAIDGESSLCLTCRHATIIKGSRLRDEIVECGCLSEDRRIRFRVNFCTEYKDRRHASLREMEELAWVLTSDLRLKQVGFVPSSKLKPADRYVLGDNWD